MRRRRKKTHSHTSLLTRETLSSILDRRQLCLSDCRADGSPAVSAEHPQHITLQPIQHQARKTAESALACYTRSNLFLFPVLPSYFSTKHYCSYILPHLLLSCHSFPLKLLLPLLSLPSLCSSFSPPFSVHLCFTFRTPESVTPSQKPSQLLASCTKLKQTLIKGITPSSNIHEYNRLMNTGKMNHLLSTLQSIF